MTLTRDQLIRDITTVIMPPAPGFVQIKDVSFVENSSHYTDPASIFLRFILVFQYFHSERVDREATGALRADPHQLILHPLGPQRPRRRQPARPEQVAARFVECGG